jgi:medium-chain acyl-[acyl-carrier-protein] hydrolase
MERLRRDKGTPEVVLQEPELMAMCLPVIRADYAVNEVEMPGEEEPFGFPIAAFGGADDERANAGEIEAWRQYTTGEFSMEVFPGDHFFLQKSAKPALLRSIERRIRAALPG